jgi:sterol desaturase/sphingolipid hydroxylase (fatty acid hydroxylase superfamily)
MEQAMAVAWAVGAGLIMIGVERALPATVLPRIPGWWARVVMINTFQVGLAVLSGAMWNLWMQGVSLFNAADWPNWLAVIVTYLASTFVFYWWHRIRHESAFWWRVAHQIHHSATRLEVLTSFYKHPFEIAINSALSAAICYPLMGCSASQGAAYTVVIAVAEMFYHWNVRTPRWMGVLIQRPESHRLHHRQFHHTRNYGDLPVWDWLFGTFANPTQANRVVCGFAPGREQLFGPMLAMQEVETQRDSEPLDIRPACFGCPTRIRCTFAERTKIP